MRFTCLRIVVCAIMSSCTVNAFPLLWASLAADMATDNAQDSCPQPHMAYGKHGDPQVDPSITFVLTQEGSALQAYCPGMALLVMVSTLQLVYIDTSICLRWPVCSPYPEVQKAFSVLLRPKHCCVLLSLNLTCDRKIANSIVLWDTPTPIIKTTI